MNTITNNNPECVLCNGHDFDCIYSGNIRDGKHGCQTSEKKSVIQCNDCGLVRLEVFDKTIEYYQSDSYRETYNGDVSVEHYISIHDKEQTPRINRIGLERFRGKNVLDYGCGGGAFLDAVCGVAKNTYGIEPFSPFHGSLLDRGHTVFSDSKSALNDIESSVDIIVSFGVIEHVENPIQYLKDAYSLLKPGGVIFIETDNHNDVISKFESEEFKKFFYRTAHLYYFDSEVLTSLVNQVGFSKYNISFRHNYDLSNLVLWIKEGKPTGCGYIDLFDDEINALWKMKVEQAGLADLVFLEAVK